MIQQLVNQTATCFVTYCIVRWIPKGRFSVQSLRRLLPFGAKVFASNFIIALFLDIRSLLIGQIYSSEALGFFNRGKQFPQAVMESVNGTIQTVLLPVYSKKQDSVSSVAKMVSKTVRISSLLLFPMMVGLAAVAEPLVSLLLRISGWNASRICRFSLLDTSFRRYSWRLFKRLRRLATAAHR